MKWTLTRVGFREGNGDVGRSFLGARRKLLGVVGIGESGNRAFRKLTGWRKGCIWTDEGVPGEWMGLWFPSRLNKNRNELHFFYCPGRNLWIFGTLFIFRRIEWVVTSVKGSDSLGSIRLRAPTLRVPQVARGVALPCPKLLAILFYCKTLYISSHSFSVVTVLANINCAIFCNAATVRYFVRNRRLYAVSIARIFI